MLGRLVRRWAHCQTHGWRLVFVRQTVTGKHRDSWRWKYRCRECGDTRLFRTPYAPNGHEKTK